MPVASREQAEFGGAIRLAYGASSGTRRLHQDLHRLTVVTVSAGHIVDLALPAKAIRHLRPGFVLHAANRGIGGTGNLRFKLETGAQYWDFVAMQWVGVPNSDCLIAPGYFAEARFLGFVQPTDDPIAVPTSTWTSPLDEPLYRCFRKAAVPSPISI